MKARRLAELPFQPAGAAWTSILRSAGRSANTIDCYMGDLRIFAACLGDDRPEAIGRLGQQSIDRIVGGWRAAGVAPSTVGRRLSVLREFAKYLVRSFAIDCRGVLAAVFPVHVRGTPVTPAASDIEAITDAVGDETEDWTELRDAAMFALMADCALTPAETAALDLGHIGPRFLEVEESAFEDRTVEISDRAGRAFARYLSSVPYRLAARGPAFVNERGERISCRTLQLRFRRRALAAGLPVGTGPSSLRRRAGGALADGGNSPEVLARALGLSTISAFRFYATARSRR